MRPIRDQCKILIVDKENKYRQMLLFMLTNLGFNYKSIIQAANGAEAWEKLASQQIDLVISGWVMPGRTGLELLKAVRANEKLAAIPFVMASAKGNQEDILMAVREKVSSYLVKPFSESVLEEKLKSIGFG